MDSTYSSLVDRVLKIKPLAEQIEHLADSKDALNLITPDWDKHLQNNHVYQKLKENAKQLYGSEKTSANQAFRLQYLDNTDLKLILVAHCSVYRSYDKSGRKQYFSITVRDSPVLSMLGEAMISDLKGVQLSDTHKCNFGSCSVCCQYCGNAMEDMMSKGIKLSFEYVEPCILDLSVYDGKNVVNRFATQISQCFGGSFVAILKLDIKMRYFYTQKESQKEFARVGANVSKMIAFPETNLQESTLSLGDLALMAKFEPLETKLESSETKLESSETKKRSFESDEEVTDIYPKSQKIEDTGYITVEEGNLDFSI